MTSSKFYNPIIKSRIEQLISKNAWPLLRNYFDHLSHGNFRIASNILKDNILIKMSEEDFWNTFYEVVPHNPKAFLVTFLKAAVTIKRRRILIFKNTHFQRYTNFCKTNDLKIDIHKCLLFLLPVSATVEEAKLLFKLFGISDNEEQLKYLITCKTNISYYLIFQIFKDHDHESDFIKKYALIILQNNQNKDFNFVEIVKVYFNIPDFKSTFSLKIDPYQLNYIDRSYESFIKTLKSI